MRQRRGAVMILVLGVLVILALLGMTFVTLQKTEQLVSKSFTDQVRARMLAWAGLEHAMSRASEVVSGSRWSTFQGNGAVAANAQWPQTTINDPVPLEFAKYPSWFYPDGNPPPNPETTPACVPRLLTIQSPCGPPVPNLQVGYTGVATWGPYGANTAIYSVKMSDTSAKLYVNDGIGLFKNPDSAGACSAGQTHSTVSQNLKWILNQLGWSLPVPNTVPTNVRIGNLIVDYREQNYTDGYPAVDEVKKALPPSLTEKQKDMIVSFLTTRAWRDPNVVDPVPLSTAVYPPSSGDLNTSYPNGYRVIYNRGNAASPRLRFGRSVGGWGQQVNVPLRWYGANGTSTSYNTSSGYGGPELFAMDELMPQYVEVVWRAPVNVNVAPKPVLEALIANVEGFFWSERRTGAPISNAPAQWGMSVKAYGGSTVNLTVWQPGGITGPYTGFSWLYIHHGFAPGNTPNITFSGSGNSNYGNGGTSPNSGRRDYDELGYLYKSGKIYGSWESPPAGSTTAATIADHIIACRAYGTFGPVNYGVVPFGGPFRTWAQFEAFINNLVAVNVIRDTTNTYWDYNPGGENATGNKWNWATGTHPVANQAVADALKANFNPNLHMNYLNPDKNMFRYVDKISLVKHTTEFSFTGSGYAEIESLGRILEPLDANGNVLPVPNAFDPGAVNRIRGEVKIVATVQLFDKYRETSQRHFNLGDNQATPGVLDPLTARQTGPETNNNTGLRTGPESINVPYPYWDTWNGYSYTVANPKSYDNYMGTWPNPATTGWGCEAEGYLALDTYGSFNHNSTVSKLPSAPVNTQTAAQGSDLTAGMHGHFTYHNYLCHSGSNTSPSDAARRELGGHPNYTGISGAGDTHPNSGYWNINSSRRTRFRNYASPGETVNPPYDPTKGDKYYRSYRSFRIPLGNDSGASTAWGNIKNKMAPLPMNHLRPDGMYSERHSGLAYWLTWGQTTGDKWYAAVWFKPNWDPQWSGRARNLISTSKYSNYNRGHGNPMNNQLLWLPAHMARHIAAQPGVTEPNEPQTVTYYGSPYSAGNDAPEEATGGRLVTRIRPSSLFFAARYYCSGGALHDVLSEAPWVEGHFGTASYTLNHQGHAVHANNAPQIEAHRWSLLGFQFWDDAAGSTSEPATQTWMNLWYAGGKSASGSSQGPTHWHAGSMYTSGGLREYWHKSQVNADGSASHAPPVPHATNAIRLGETSQHGLRVESNSSYAGNGQHKFPRNWVADATFDEFYLWLNPPNKYTSTPPGYMAALYGGVSPFRGRYYRPALGNNQDCIFSSALLSLSGSTSPRGLAPPGSATPPSGGSMVAVPAPGASVKKRRLLGVSWTWMAEGYDYVAPPGALPPGTLPSQVMAPYWIDYARTDNGNGSPGTLGGLRTNTTPDKVHQSWEVDPNDGKWKYKPMCLVRVRFSGAAPDTWTSWLWESGYVEMKDSTGTYPVLQTGSSVQYQVWFQLTGVSQNSLILVTPYFDDITFFYDNGGPQLIDVQYMPAYVPPC